MSDRVLIDADLKFVQGVISAGGEDLKKCYQCSTCTVVCPLTPDGAPFPRKEMISAQWGIKDKLLKSMDPWLCFHCNDCSDQCPREAKPGDVMAAIRKMIIANLAAPSFIGKATASVAGSIGLLLIPMVIIAAVIIGIHGTDLAFLSSDPIIFSKMLSVPVIDTIFLSAAAFALLTAFLGLKKLIAGLQENFPRDSHGETLSESVVGTIKDLLFHQKFRECGVNKSRNLGHLLLFYGFVGLLLTTTCVVVIHYLNVFGYDIDDTPLPFFHPVKILGNISAALALVGIVLIAWRRLFSPVVGKSTAFDWIFIGDIILIVTSGILAQVVRTAGISPLAYIIYYFHLVFVFFLFAYAPHSKFGHIFYRSASLIYARYSGRSKSVGVNLLENIKQSLPEETKGAA